MSRGPLHRVGVYHLLAELGEGGMGVVYRAHDERLGREVAVKLLKPELAGQLDRVRRFTTEARAMAAVAHPNIVAVYDVGSWNGRPYIVSELLEGETLRDRIVSGGAIEVTTAVRYAIHITLGLEAAHTCGLVHRDLKSENVFLTSDGQIKLLDFGIAALIAGDPERGGASVEGTAREDTQPGDPAGTPACMSPEQIRGLPADHRTDIFALGVALHEMLSGRRPFVGRTPGETMAMVLHDDPPPLGRRIPEPLRQVVSRCLQKRPEDRFSSAHDLAMALHAVGSARRPERLVSVWPPTGRTGEAPDRTWQRGAWLAVVSAAVALAILGFRIVNTTSGRGPPRAGLVPHRVAVVPFSDVDGHGQLESIGVLAAIELSRSLATLREVEVVRTETEDAYPLATLPSAQSVGGATGAGLVLYGTVTGDGGTVEFAATLEDSATGRIVRVFDPVSASHEYPADALGVLGGWLEIAVLEHLHPALGFGSGDGWPRLDAYREYRRSLEDAVTGPLEEAFEHVYRAIELDPGFAQVRLVWAGGMTFVRPDVIGPGVSSTHLPRLLPLDRAALSASQARILDGILMRIAGNWMGASQVFQDVLERDPRSCVARMYVIDSAVRANRPQQAIDVFEELVWDPIIPPQAKEIAFAAAAKAYHILGRHDDELGALERLGPGPVRESARLWAAQQKMIALAAAGRLELLYLKIEDALVQPEVTPHQRAQVMVDTAVELREHGHRVAATRLAERALEGFRESMPSQHIRDGFGSCCFDAMHLTGRAEEAHALVLASAPAWPDPFERAKVLGLAAARSGRESAAREQMIALTHLDRPARYGQVAYAQARIAALLGDRDEALHFLRRAIANGFWDYPGLRCCPDFERLRSDPEFRRLIEPTG